MSNNIYQCDQCDKSFKTHQALNAHKQFHMDIPSRKGISIFKRIQCKFCNYYIIEKDYEKHMNNRKQCLNCDNYFCVGSVYDENNKRIRTPINQFFCSKTCSSNYNRNKIKIENGSSINACLTYKNKTINYKNLSLEKQMKRMSLQEFIETFVCGEFTKIRKNFCKHCGKLFYYKGQKHYCKLHDNLYSENNRSKYEFTFPINYFPELFDLSLIDKIGWYDNHKNKNGLTRDHKVSITEAIKNNYDPYYIKHPLNCELMLMNDNNRKNTNSSMEYKELVKNVDNWDELNSPWDKINFKWIPFRERKN